MSPASWKNIVLAPITKHDYATIKFWGVTTNT
jgi:hypothetical protein